MQVKARIQCCYSILALVGAALSGCTGGEAVVESNFDNDYDADPTLGEMIAGGLGQAPADEDPEVAKAFEEKGWQLYKDMNFNTREPMVVLKIDSELAPEDYELIARSKVVTYLNLMSAEPTDAGLAELSALPTLETLLLMGDSVTNEGVKSLANCKNLRNLHLSMLKDITDEAIAPLGKLTKLETLAVSRAKLTGECFAEFAEHPKLRVLHLEYIEGFTDEGAAYLARIPHLEDLELGTTSFYGDSSSPITSAGIRAIVNGNMPDRFECSPKLINDELFVEMLEKGWIPPNSEIKVATKPEELKVLLLEGYNIGDAGFRAAMRFTNASHVNIKEIDLSDEAFAEISQLKRIDWLSIEECGISGKALEAVTSLPIEHLAIEECELTEDHFIAIGKLHQLDELWLSDSKFDPVWLTHIRGMPKLTDLNLRSAAFDDEAAKVVGELPALEEITVNDTELGDEGFQLLLEHPKLRSILVNGTNVTKEVYLAAKKKHSDKSFYFYRYDSDN